MVQTKQEKGSLAKAGQSIVLNVEGLATLALDITGTFVGTGTFEYTIDGINWYTLTLTDPFVVATTATTATAVGQFRGNVSGFQRVRVRCSAYTSGTMGVYLRAID